jgi:hypothetical protein
LWELSSRKKIVLPGELVRRRKHMVMDRNEQVVQQATIILPYFDYEVPLLSLAGGNRSIPVVALCRLLGLCMFCGMCTVCSSTRETQVSSLLLPGHFYNILAIEFTCSKSSEIFTGDRNTISFEVYAHRRVERRR